jgi:glycyl-tRNA synthetase beta chain
MATLLLEIFSEEIPARMQAPAAEQLAGSVRSGLEKLGYKVGSVESFVSPRHLAVRVSDLPAKQDDVSEERKGPRANAPQPAIDGFLRSTGLTLEQLELRGDTYFAMIETKGRDTAEALVPMLNDVLANFSWPKSMRWGAGEKSWVRPMHSIIALLDSTILPVQWGNVKAGNTTRGHRFLAPDAITIAHPSEYKAKLKEAYVWIEALERETAIRNQLSAAADKAGLALNEDEGLLREVTGLVEFSSVLTGKIDADYMHLPPEVLISEMKEHQRYFALLTADGKLADRFLITSNMDVSRMEDGGAAVIAGNERVLRARLADGKFFWEQDNKVKLADWAKKLDSMVFHAKLGTMSERVMRLKNLSIAIAEKLKFDVALAARAAELAKADLTTGMVGEFPELQGVMGRYYAKAQGEKAEVAEAIAEHYKPAGANDNVPNAPLSITVALADKLDVLAGMFAVGEKPTGSKDPFALRRAALGVLRIIRGNTLSLKLNDVLQIALSNIGQKHQDETRAELLAFFHDRLKVMLRDEGIRHDAVDAVLSAQSDDVLDITARARALQAMLESEDGANLLAGYKRASNILRAEEKKDNTIYTPLPKAETLAVDAEKALFAALNALETEAAPLLAKADYTGAMKALATLRAPVDRFFVDVMVNDADTAIRTNRLQLLARLRAQVQQVANFDAIQG